MIRKITFVLWPRRLVAKDDSGSRFVGWVWMQRAVLINNLNHGWVAFVDDQTPDKLDPKVCPTCKQYMFN